MDNVYKLIIFPMIMLLSFGTFSQDTSSVLIQELKGEYRGKTRKGLANGNGFAKGVDSYKGKFKKGLPHGDGKYVWADGSMYIGKWYNGEQSGEGTYIYTVEGKDSVLTGFWKKGMYTGPVSKSPVVKRYYNIDSFKFTKGIGTLDRVLLDFMQNGTTNNKIENLMLSASSGSRTSIGSLVGFDNIVFPVTITARYDTYNKLGTKKVNAFVEFIIYEKGDWEVEIKN